MKDYERGMSPEERERLEERRADRAGELIFNTPALLYRFAHALDVLGYKIVSQDPERNDVHLLMPFQSKRKAEDWPSWMRDGRKSPQKPSLRLVKSDDQGPDDGSAA